ALGVQVPLRGAAEHERQYHLGEQHGLQVWFGLDRFGEPGLHLGRAQRRDDVPLAVRPLTGPDVADDHLAVPGQPAEGRVDLTEGQRSAPAEEGVVVALQVVAVARFAFEQAEQGQRDAHADTIHRGYTSRIYPRRVRRLPGHAPVPVEEAARRTV